MPLTSAQIVALSLQISKAGSVVGGVATGFTQQAGQFLNSILSDLCQTYDLEVASSIFSFNMNPNLVVSSEFPQNQAGSGPYTLPADYLRAKRDGVYYFNSGQSYRLIPIDIQEYDYQVQQAGNQAFPFLFATDMTVSPPIAVVWPGANQIFPTQVRYYLQMPDIGSGKTSENGFVSGSAAPETSNVIPWFPNQRYLIKQLSGMLMEITDDDRAETWLGDGDGRNPGAMAILRSYLQMQGDQEDRAQRVILDRRRFGGGGYSNLPTTKQTGFP